MNRLNACCRAEQVFKIAAFLSLLTGLVFYYAPGITINIHDTYFIINRFHIAFVISVFCMLCSVVYTSFIRWKRPLNRILACLHVVFTPGVLLVMLFIYRLYPWNEVRRYRPDTSAPFAHTMSYVEKLNTGMGIAAFLLVLAQLLFIVNVILTLVKRREA